MRFVSSFYNRFKSLKFTAVIFGSLILVYFAGLVIPQKMLFPSYDAYKKWLDKSILFRIFDALKLTEIYLSPLTIALLTLFFANLLVIVGNRAVIIIKKVYPDGKGPDFNPEGITGVKVESSLPLQKVRERLDEALRKKRWKVLRTSNPNTLFAVKNRFSPLGFLLFHLSFLLCLIGGLLITYTRFYGYLVITEGQTLGDARPHIVRVIRKPKVLKKLPEFGLRLIKVVPQYENDVPTDLDVVLEILYKNKTRKEVLKVNEPVKRGPLTLLVQDIWLAPLMVLKDKNGRVIDGAYVALNLLHGQKDFFRFDTLKDYKFTALFFPDYIVTEDNMETTKSVVIRNPALHIWVEKDGRNVAEKTLFLNDSVSFDDYSLSFNGYRYSAYLSVIREYGKTPLIVGFVLALAGLIMRLIFYQKRLWIGLVRRDERITEIVISGNSELLKLSFQEEVNKLAEYIREKVS